MQSLRIRPITPNPPVHLKHFFIFPVLPTPNSPSSHPQPIPSAVTNQKGATFQTVYEKTPIFSMNTHRTSIFPSRSVSTSTAKSETTTCGSQQSQNLAAEPYCLRSSSFSLFIFVCHALPKPFQDGTFAAQLVNQPKVTRTPRWLCPWCPDAQQNTAENNGEKAKWFHGFEIGKWSDSKRTTEFQNLQAQRIWTLSQTLS